MARFQDFAYDDFAGAEIARLEELRVQALETRIEADLQRGLSGELVGELEELVQHEPLRERPVVQLMHALYRAGRQAEAFCERSNDSGTGSARNSGSSLPPSCAGSRSRSWCTTPASSRPRSPAPPSKRS